MFNAHNPKGIIAFEGHDYKDCGTGIVLRQEPPSAEAEVYTHQLFTADNAIAEYYSSKDKVDQLTEVTQTLWGIAAPLTDANKGDGVSRSTAAALSAAVEHMCACSSLSHRRIFCVENHQGKMARINATNVALESIADYIKTAIRQILKWLKSAMFFIFDSVQELIQGADNIVEKSRAIQAKAKLISHKSLKPGNDFIDGDDYLRSFFTEKGTVIATDDLVKTYQDYTAQRKTDFSTFLKEMVRQISEAVTDSAEGATLDETLVKSDVLIRKLKAKAFHSLTLKSDDASHEVLSSELPFGQRELIISLSKEADKYSGIKVILEKSKKVVSASGNSKLSTLSYAQITAVTAAIEKEMLFGLFKDYPGTRGDLLRIQKAVVQGCDKITDSQQSDKTPANSAVSYSVNFLKELTASVIEMTSIVHKYDIKVAKALLGYCEYSIKMYS